MKHAIYGSLTFKNGNTIHWLRFIDDTFTKKEAEIEAVRLVTAQHKGDAIQSLTVNPNLLK